MSLPISVLNSLKRSPWYKESWYLYRSLARGQLGSYLYHRFWVRRKLRAKGLLLDRPPATRHYSLHLLCGHRDLDLLLWALASWHRVVPEGAPVYIHEDGTFARSDRKLLQRLLPHAEIVDYREATHQAATRWLADFPALRRHRRERRFIWTVKLLDPYFVSACPYVLILDTDILWFRQPQELLERIREGRQPAFWPGPRPWTFPLRDGCLRSRINTGLVFYRRDRLELARLEEFCRRIGPSLGPPLLDEPGYAYAFRPGQGELLSLQQHIIKGPVGSSTVAKHYTGPRREQFWWEGVRLLRGELLAQGRVG